MRIIHCFLSVSLSLINVANAISHKVAFPENHRDPIIIDTDPGVDDAFNMFFMMLSPEVDVRAITLTYGNTNLENVERSAVTLLHTLYEHYKYMDWPIPDEFPVLSSGSSGPLEPEYAIPTQFGGRDGMADIFTKGIYRAPEHWKDDIRQGKNKECFFRTTPRDAADEILHQLKQAPPLTVSILAVGPLTNLAVAYQRDPVTFSRAKRLVILGGAVNGPGNTTPFAEANFASDPKAAMIIFGISKGFNLTADRLERVENQQEAPVEIVLLPIEAGRFNITITKQVYEERVEPVKTPISRILGAMHQERPDCKDKRDCQYYHTIYDPLAGLLLLDLIGNRFDEHWTSCFYDLRVETRGEYTMGQTVCDQRRPMLQRQAPWNERHSDVQVILRGNGARYHDILMDRLFPNSHTYLDLI